MQVPRTAEYSDRLLSRSSTWFSVSPPPTSDMMMLLGWVVLLGLGDDDDDGPGLGCWAPPASFWDWIEKDAAQHCLPSWLAPVRVRMRSCCGDECVE